MKEHDPTKINSIQKTYEEEGKASNVDRLGWANICKGKSCRLPADGWKSGEEPTEQKPDITISNKYKLVLLGKEYAVKILLTRGKGSVTFTAK